jgi:hypothetical protein
MDWNRIEGNWEQFKGKAKEKWGRLTDDDLDVINGRRDPTPATRLSRSSATPSAALSLSNRRLYISQRIRGGLSGYSSSAGSPPSLRRSLRARRRALSYLVSRWEA